MLTTLRRDRRNRRQALFTLEALDNRLVLSAGAGAVAGAAHAAAVEARHARIEARHEARLAARAAMAAPAPVAVTAKVSTPVAAAAASTGSSAATPSAAVATPVKGSSGPIGTIPTLPTGGSSTLPVTLPSNVSAQLQMLYNAYESAGGGSTAPSEPGLQISGSSVEVSIKVSPGTAFDTALADLQKDGMQVSSSSSTYNLIDGMLPISELPAAAQVAAGVVAAPAPVLQ
jgi:hypothetical protein